MTLFQIFISIVGLVICWLLWEIHQKLHRTLEINWRAYSSLESRLDALIDKNTLN